MHAVTKTDMLLEQVAGLLTEIRDRLPEPKSETKPKQAKTAAKKAPAKKSATPTSKK